MEDQWRWRGRRRSSRSWRSDRREGKKEEEDAMMPAIGLLLVHFRKCFAHLRRYYDLDIADLGNSACVQELLNIRDLNR